MSEVIALPAEPHPPHPIQCKFLALKSKMWTEKVRVGDSISKKVFQKIVE